MMPRYMRGAKPLMSAPPAAIAPTSSGGVVPQADYRTARLQNPSGWKPPQGERTKPMRMNAGMAAMQSEWNQGTQAGPMPDLSSRFDALRAQQGGSYTPEMEAMAQRRIAMQNGTEPNTQAQYDDMVARRMAAMQGGGVQEGSGGQWSEGTDRLGRMIEAGGPQGQPMANPSWDGTMFGVRLPQSQPTVDEARRQLDDMTRGGGVTAGPAVTGPNGGIPGLPGYDPNANVQGVGSPQPAPMPEIPQRIRSRMVRAAGERPLMGRGYRL